MLGERIEELRAEAKRMGQRWKAVCELKSELVEHERLRREATDGARQRAWELFCLYNGRSVAGCRAFWRCGFDQVRRRIENKGRDYSAIKRYDEIAATIHSEFGEWPDAGELWAWLLGDYEPWPPRGEFYSKAIELLGARREAREEVPF